MVTGQLLCRILLFRVVVIETRQTPKRIIRIYKSYASYTRRTTSHNRSGTYRSRHVRYATVLKDQCFEIENYVNSHRRRFILKNLKNRIHNRLEHVRDQYYVFNQRFCEANRPMSIAYYYIVGIEIRVPGALQQVDHYLYDRHNESASTVSHTSTISRASTK